MTIKENLEQARMELIQKREERKKSDTDEIKVCKNKIRLLHEKSLVLIESHKSIINNSGCIKLIEDLIKEEKLTLHRGGVWPDNAADKIEFLNRYFNSGKSEGLLTDLLELAKVNNEDFLKKIKEKDRTDSLSRINENSLFVCDCSAYLIWDKYYETDEYDYWDRTWYCKHALYKLIGINFDSSSIDIFGNEKELSVSPENIDNNILEKAICRAYLNPIFRDVSGLDYTK